MFLYGSLEFIGIMLMLSVFMCYSVILWAILLIALPFVLKECHAGLKNYRSKDSMREVKNILLVYRTIEIIVKMWMDVFGHLFIPAQNLCGQIALVISYTLINTSHLLDSQALIPLVFIFLMSQLIWMSVLIFGGTLANKGVMVLGSWRFLKTKNSTEAKYIAKYRKGCNPLKIGLLGVFTIKRLTFPKYVYGLTRGIFRALLTFQRKKS